MSISAADVKRLRDMTNAPMMDCKAALEEAKGNMAKADQILREKNKTIAASKGARETAEGRIAVFADPAKSVASILEMRCESAPVAKNESFVQLANDVAKHIAAEASAPADVAALLGQKFHDGRTVKDRVEDLVGLIRENMKPQRFARLTGGSFGHYIHHDGSVGVLLQVDAKGAVDPQLLRDVCMHIAAKQPAAGRREDVDPAVVQREMEIAKNQAAALGKPANIAEKIAEGKIKTWYAENILLEQPFVKDDSKSVGDLLNAAGVTLKTFIRYKVGEVAL